MSFLLASGGVILAPHQQDGPTQQIVRVVPPTIFYAGLIFIGLVCLSYWLGVREHLKNCQCPKPAKKWWKR